MVYVEKWCELGVRRFCKFNEFLFVTITESLIPKEVLNPILVTTSFNKTAVHYSSNIFKVCLTKKNVLLSFLNAQGDIRLADKVWLIGLAKALLLIGYHKFFFLWELWVSNHKVHHRLVTNFKQSFWDPWNRHNLIDICKFTFFLKCARFHLFKNIVIGPRVSFLFINKLATETQSSHNILLFALIFFISHYHEATGISCNSGPGVLIKVIWYIWIARVQLYTVCHFNYVIGICFSEIQLLEITCWIKNVQ